MKAFPAIKMIGGALIVLASLNVYAQSSDASAPAAAAPTAKQTKAADRALGRKVRSALSKTKGLSVANITVRARGGAVTLAGSVPEQPQVDLATQAAQGVAGVTSVKNALTIRPVGQ
ncbi:MULTISPECIES: BON domain-containing protein [unclassified Paraburkholderia]|uniref:BON domain-containing protein n=1 Tax=unclassified Paraburkholderia TaxID=2615204 RepID=UPI000D04EE0B|nr:MULTISPECIES: BON domain-containing protein [unclassified Paraburkholderia]PRY08474.1 BON domain-containing protein [Paraburkholderia sp. BL25I1N1]REE21648.1 BON domain-containing protein [Paraburkholderia sp. BL27I4N3]REG49765.1 BON domain-containing protein [Paraburkholderia sp. BL6669N2]RKR38780.1 BON domain-containing protein [Paraburkholderia sp. BL17N1]TDY22244.1 BON domain-containing protein [Paraburkholderia sp. BL6665CI2N2]